MISNILAASYKCTFIVNSDEILKSYLVTKVKIKVTVEVVDDPEDSNDGVVDAHVVDLDVLDMGEGEWEGVVLDVDDLVDEDNGTAENDVWLPNVSQVGIKDVQDPFAKLWLTFLLTTWYLNIKSFASLRVEKVTL